MDEPIYCQTCLSQCISEGRHLHYCPDGDCREVNRYFRVVTKHEYLHPKTPVMATEKLDKTISSKSKGQKVVESKV